MLHNNSSRYLEDCNLSELVEVITQMKSEKYMVHFACSSDTLKNEQEKDSKCIYFSLSYKLNYPILNIQKNKFVF